MGDSLRRWRGASALRERWLASHPNVRQNGRLPIMLYDALHDMVEAHYGPRTINVDADSIYTGALGAAEFARRAYEGGARPEAQA